MKIRFLILKFYKVNDIQEWDNFIGRGNHRLANLIYIHILIPLVSGKLAMPIAVSFIDNSNETFNKDMIE